MRHDPETGRTQQQEDGRKRNMAERRMFAKAIIDSDVFLDMNQTAQLLYFHLAMRADDDGFINNPKAIMRNARCSEEDLRLLAAKKFIIPFESGIVVIKHWKIHNYIAKDRYKETKYKDEKALLILDENNSYTECIQVVDECETQVRLGKVSIVKDSIDKEKYKRESTSSGDTPTDSLPSGNPDNALSVEPKAKKHKYGEYNNVLLTDEELEKLKDRFPDWESKINNLSSYIESKGAKYKSHYATILNWAKREAKEPRKQGSGYMDAIRNRVDVVDEWLGGFEN